MAGKKAAEGSSGTKDRILLNRLTRVTKEVSWGNYAKARKLFELTKTDTYPKTIAELAEAFGMMLVKVESREFKLAQLVEDMEKSYKELITAQKALDASNRTLERRVRDRTAQWNQKNLELTHTLQLFKKEIGERKQADKELKKLNKQLEEVNRKLMDAYLLMRQKKDRLAARQYVESIVFWVDDEGRICGVTENSIEMTGKSRSDLHNCNIREVLEPQKGQTFNGIMRQVRPRMPYLTNLMFKGQPDNQLFYEAKLTRVVVDEKRLISIVMHEPLEK